MAQVGATSCRGRLGWHPPAARSPCAVLIDARRAVPNSRSVSVPSGIPLRGRLSVLPASSGSLTADRSPARAPHANTSAYAMPARRVHASDTARSAAAATISSGPRQERAWARGAEGEAKLMDAVAAHCGPRFVAPHRRVPGSEPTSTTSPSAGTASSSSIRALRVSPRRGAARWSLSPRRHTCRRRAGQDQLVDGVIALLEVVSGRESPRATWTVPVLPVLCFVDGDWPFMPRLEVRGVPIIWPRKTTKLCCGAGPLNPASEQTLAYEIARRLPAA